MALSAQLAVVAVFLCCAVVLPLGGGQPAPGKQPSAAQSTPAPSAAAVPDPGGMLPAARTAAAGSYGKAATPAAPGPAAAPSPAAFGPPAPKAPKVLGSVVVGTASQFGGPQASCNAMPPGLMLPCACQLPTNNSWQECMLDAGCRTGKTPRRLLGPYW